MLGLLVMFVCTVPGQNGDKEHRTAECFKEGC